MIMSLDVSTKSTGLAIFNDNNKLVHYKLITASSSDLIKRIQKITKEIQETIEEYPQVTKLILEEVRPEDSVGLNTNTHRALMWAQASIAFMIHDNYPKITMEYIYPGTWRKDCGIKTGRGIKRESLKRADIQFVKDNYQIDVNDDIADAICIGHAYQLKNPPGFNWA